MGLNPSAYTFPVLQPVLAEIPLQLLLLSPNENIDQRQMQNGNEHRSRRSKEQRCAKKNNYFHRERADFSKNGKVQK
jgi:hypothetical protein